MFPEVHLDPSNVEVMEGSGNYLFANANRSALGFRPNHRFHFCPEIPSTLTDPDDPFAKTILIQDEQVIALEAIENILLIEVREVVDPLRFVVFQQCPDGRDVSDDGNPDANAGRRQRHALGLSFALER